MTMSLISLAIVLFLPLLTHADDSCPGLPKCFCSKDKTSVNCDGKRFTELPEEIPLNATKLFLKFNNIVNITSHAFSQYQKLEKLDLTRNKIVDIQPYAFANATALKYIDLRENKLTVIGANAFSFLPELKELILMTNRIETIDGSAFEGTEMLAYITLQSNALTTIPSFGKQPKLQKIILQGNKVQNATLPGSFKDSKGLQYIGLSSNKIEILEERTFQPLANVTLSSLYLSDNKIKEVHSGTFEVFASISSLKLSQNPLNGTRLKTALDSLYGKSMASLDLAGLRLNGHLLQDTFKSLHETTLTAIDMRYNSIPVLASNSFNGLGRLLQLDLSNCNIAETEFAAFLGLDKLQILHMTKNKLITIPQNLPYSLTRLFLDGNQIHTVDSMVFKNLVYLQELRIRNNKIQTLMQDSFHGLISLDKLDLQNNHVATLPGAVFSPLVRLTELNIAKNNLFSIPRAKKRFSSLRSLKYFNMADNKCTFLQYDIFKYMVSLEHLHLENNQLGSLIEGDVEGLLFKGLLKLEDLNLMENGISKIQGHAFQDLTSLIRLNLTNNRINTWPDNLFKSTEYLRFVDLTNNLVTVPSATNIEQFVNIEELNLTGNPFLCGCELRWFRSWMNETNVRLVNEKAYMCVQSGSWSDRPVLEFFISDLDCLLFSWKGMSTLATIIITISVYVYRQRWDIKLKYHKWKYGERIRERRKTAGNNKKYDGYISYAEDDRLWVINNLLYGIDNGNLDDDHPFGGEFALYFEERDSEPGRRQFDNIHENMLDSRKVIIVLSREYLSQNERYNHLFEVDQAVRAMYEGLIEEIILVFRDQGLPENLLPRELATSMRRHRMIEWNDNENARELFNREMTNRLRVRADAANIGAD